MTYPDKYRIMLAKMGYYDYQNGLISNHLQQEGRWDSHLNKCRSLILARMDQLNPQSVTVLGSGWLLDLPLAEMLDRSCTVTLIDIVHPPEVISQLKNIKNVNLIEADATGGLIETVWNRIKGFTFLRKKPDINDIPVPTFTPGSDPGFVISLNLTTQLESRIVSYILKKTGIKGDELVPFRRKVQENHLNFLRQHNSLMITDYEEHVTRKGDGTEVTATLLADMRDDEITGRWTWDFDLTGRENYNSTIVFRELAAQWTKDAERREKKHLSD